MRLFISVQDAIKLFLDILFFLVFVHLLKGLPVDRLDLLCVVLFAIDELVLLSESDTIFLAFARTWLLLLDRVASIRFGFFFLFGFNLGL